jgi:hypothetical protein
METGGWTIDSSSVRAWSEETMMRKQKKTGNGKRLCGDLKIGWR